MTKLIVILTLIFSMGAFAQRSKTSISKTAKAVNFDRATQMEFNVINSDAEVAGIPSIGFDGFSIAGRKNYGMDNKYFDYASSGLRVARLEGDKSFGAAGKVEIKSLEFGFDQRIGISKRFEDVLLRPYIGATAALQRNKGSSLGQSSSKTKFDMYPTIGVEANFAQEWGANLSYTSRDIDFGDKVIANNDTIAFGFSYAL